MKTIKNMFTAQKEFADKLKRLLAGYYVRSLSESVRRGITRKKLFQSKNN